ncbi:hypothetical protein L1049_001664 [Liquidambar formosana]|uniref:Uncharacterized protein n=1 Tax=Liquidambar formosana TaxID=63359 RepID=A0AAP0N583_LIQFO
MAENPKLIRGLEEMDTQKISVVSDYKSEKSDSFVVDIESFSHGTDKDRNANSRITLQRSLSRKGCQRGGEKRTSSSATANERDTVVATSSPRAALVGAGTPEMPMVVALGSTDHPSNPQVHHQITITASNISTNTESRWGSRKNSFRRSPPSWAIDPRKILIFFATLSSMGTILLIYFTLSMSKINTDNDALNWQQ